MTDIVVPLESPTSFASRAGDDFNSELADLYHALCADAISAVDESGGELFLATGATDTAAQNFATDLQSAVLTDGDAAELLTVDRHEDQPDFRSALASVRNASPAASVGILNPCVTLLGRQQLDTAAMRLRRDDTVIGPTPAGGWYYLGTQLEIDAVPESLSDDLARIAKLFADDDWRLGFLPLLPVINAPTDIAHMRTLVVSMHRGNRPISPYTAAWLDQYSDIHDRRTDTS